MLNRVIDALPVVPHLQGYRFCGPRTKFSNRLARGEHGINESNEAYREHGIAYSEYKDNEHRRVVKRTLAEKAWQRAKECNSGASERANAATVVAAMEAKSALGGGGRRCKTSVKRNEYVRRILADVCEGGRRR